MFEVTYGDKVRWFRHYASAVRFYEAMRDEGFECSMYEHVVGPMGSVETFSRSPKG